MRRYRTGTRWGVWLWSEVVRRGVRYLTRLHLVKTPKASAYLHWIHEADPQPDPHDHPVTFLSIVLRGGYVEENTCGKGQPVMRPRGRRWWRREVRWFNFIRATHVHRIVHVEPGTLTLCFAGPPVHEWGFHTLRFGGWFAGAWISWKDYDVCTCGHDRDSHTRLVNPGCGHRGCTCQGFNQRGVKRARR